MSVDEDWNLIKELIYFFYMQQIPRGYRLEFSEGHG